MEEIKTNNQELTSKEKREIKKEVKEIIKEQEKNNQTENTIKKELTREEKIIEFFDKIEFLAMDDIQKEEVAKKVKNDSSGDKLYWIEVFLSSMIASLWLIQWYSAVVIWAMLIAPFLRPINWLSFSVARWWQKFYLTALRVLIFSIILSISVWYIITKIIWIETETTEIISRTNYNLIDFFIAIFSAMIAILSLRFQRLWESIAWVAMAASLLPPLSVIWIEIALWNYYSAFWAIMLFSTNLFAIIMVSTIFFWLYWFNPHDSRLQSKVIKRISIMSIIVVIIMLSLFISFNSSKNNNTISKEIKTYIEETIASKIEDFEIKNLYIVENKKDYIKIKLDLVVKEWVYIIDTIENINWWLWKTLNKEVDLEIEIKRVLNIISK